MNTTQTDWPLRLRTPPAWAAALTDHVPVLLLEQAHLERKAAAAAVALLFRNPVRHGWQRPLSTLAREELLHFERVLRLMETRGSSFQRLEPGGYASQLKQCVTPTMPIRLVDELLVCGVIEARSCERMALLIDALKASDPEVASLYADLVQAEGRHHETYVALAHDILPADQVAERWAAVTEHEADVLTALPWKPRLHGGLPGAEAAAESS